MKALLLRCSVIWYELIQHNETFILESHWGYDGRDTEAFILKFLSLIALLHFTSLLCIVLYLAFWSWSNLISEKEGGKKPALIGNAVHKLAVSLNRSCCSHRDTCLPSAAQRKLSRWDYCTDAQQLHWWDLSDPACPDSCFVLSAARSDSQSSHVINKFCDLPPMIHGNK